MPLGGTGTIPGRPIGGYNPYPVPIGYPQLPGNPGIPVVLNPTPPVTTPTTPGGTTPDPGTTPTIPVGLPGSAPTVPNENSTKFWSPWPLPPRGNQVNARAIGFDAPADNSASNNLSSGGNDASYVRQSSSLEDVNATPAEDLKYRGGRTIRDLSYVNLYVSGDTQWQAADVERIDASLAAAMRDEHLNNVLLQYFENQTISSTPLPSHPLIGYTPKTVSRGDIQDYASYLHQQGFLQTYDLKNTVFNFLLPPGTVLTADQSSANPRVADNGTRSFGTTGLLSKDEQIDSTQGLGGYHGSVVTANGARIYFSVDVYSQRFSNGATNGIPVFNEPWKNVVATLYHQLIETRTDPDVEDANRESSDLNSSRSLGWVSDSGQEVAGIPISANVPLSSVFREIPLANGNGTVPIQLPYSNFVHGPEGPIAQPHPLP